MTRKTSIPSVVLANAQPSQSTTTGEQVIANQAVTAAAQKSVEQSLIYDKGLHFTQSQLSLALSIQKSKPSDICTRDYCLQLRKHIRLGKLPAKEEQRHIDTTEFWKDQYSRLYLEKKRSAERIAQLEYLVQQNRGHDQASSSQPEETVLSYEQTSSDRFQTMTEPCLSNWPVFCEAATLLKELEAPNNLPLLKRSLILHRLLQDKKAPTDVLLSAILSLLLSMTTMIKETSKTIGQRSGRNDNSGNDRALRILDTVAASFNICLKGLSHLCRDIPGRRSKGQAIYGLVKFYKICLDQLHELCTQEVSYEQSKIRQNENQRLTNESNEDSRFSIFNSGYVLFLAKVLRCSELLVPQTCHHEVLEGLLSTLLEVTGSLLSQVVFGEPVSFSSTSDGTANNATAIPHSAKKRVAELAGRHLAYVLKRATQGSSEKENRILATMAGESSGYDSAYDTSSGKSMLLGRARKRFQETLLKAVFGDNGKDFITILKMPESAECGNIEPSQVPTAQESTFVEAVWSAVGWDLILSP